MSISEQILNALQQEHPFETVYSLLVTLRQQQIPKQDIITAIESLRSQVTEDDEDLLLEMLDFLTGFCSPHLKID